MKHFKKLLTSRRPSITFTKAALSVVGIKVAPGFKSLGKYLYVPDLCSAYRLGYANGHASVMGWFEEKEPVKGPDGEETVKAGLFPRNLLHRIAE